MNGEWWNIPLVVTTIGTLIAGIWAFVNRKGTERSKARALLPPTWPEMWQHMKDQDARIDKLEAVISKQNVAMTNILRTIASEWPKGSQPPVLDQKDINALGDIIPEQWLRDPKK